MATRLMMIDNDALVLRAVTFAADNNRPCPSNPEIADMLSAPSASAGVSCLQRLARRGLITVQRFQNARQVTIVASGRSTYLDPTQAIPHWRDRPEGQTSVRAPSVKRRYRAPDANARVDGDLPRPVFRDPCPRCGTRADIGCAHQAGRLSMGAFA